MKRIKVQQPSQMRIVKGGMGTVFFPWMFDEYFCFKNDKIRIKHMSEKINDILSKSRLIV